MMKNNEKQSRQIHKVWNKILAKRFWSAVLLLVCCLMLGGRNVQAASYSGDYRYWSQGGSDYSGMRQVGCLITAQAKMLYEANVNRNAGFNPDAWYNWLLANGGIASSTNLNMRDHNAPANYARSIGKNLEYLGYWKADDAQLWYNINAGYYTIVYVSGTNTGGSHFVLLDNALSKQTGILYCYDSFSDRGTVAQQKLTRYSIHNGGHVYKGSNAVHTHSYSSSVTRQPGCTQTGVRSYTCSCGASYTETINAAGHKYVSKTIDPTQTEQGYTLHTCSVCGAGYKDNYVEPAKKTEDGWYYSAKLPSWVSADDYTIQYQNYYEKIQQSSPGTGWSDAGVVKNEWQNSGSTYTSATDLPASDSRMLVRSVYYHFCGPNAGAEGNYEQTGKFVHYDEILASSVTAQYLGTDNGHPYYFIYSNGGQVWCKSGVSCNGAYGTHGSRCRAWYKMNTYQDRVKVVQYKFTKTSDWVETRDASAASVKIRFKERDNTEAAGGITEEIVTGKPDIGEIGTEEPSTEEPGTEGTDAENPGADETVTENPGPGEDVTEKADTNESATKNPGADENLTGTPATDANAIENPGTGETVTGETGAGKIVVEKPAVSGSVTAKPAANSSDKKTVTVSATSAPKATALSGTPTAKSRAFQVKWKKQSGISGYQIQYSTNKSFKASATRTKTVKKAGTTKLTVKKLKAKKKYYVRIRTYKTVNGRTYYSGWSKSKSVKTKR